MQSWLWTLSYASLSLHTSSGTYLLQENRNENMITFEIVHCSSIYLAMVGSWHLSTCSVILATWVYVLAWQILTSGIPWSLTTSFRVIHATPLAVTVVMVSTRWTCVIYQSVMTNKYSKLFHCGSGPRKSIPMDWHGLSRIGRLWSKPFSLLFASLDAAQAPHDMQNDSMSCTIEVYQKYLLMYCTV